MIRRFIGFGVFLAVVTAMSPGSSAVAGSLPATPGAPGNLVVTKTDDTTGVLSWSPATDNGSAITGYTVQRLSGTDTTWQPFATTDAATTRVTITLPGYNTSYDFTVFATSAAGDGAEAGTRVDGLYAPNSPSGLKITAQADPTKATLTWAPAEGSPTGSWNVYRSTSATVSTTAGATLLTPTPTTETTLTVDLPPMNQTYWFLVAGINAAGEGQFAESRGVAGPTFPAAPTSFTVTGQTDSTATFGWAAAAQRGEPVTGYVLERSTDGGSSWTTAAGVGADVLTADAGMPPAGSAWVYRVRATSIAGNGLPSDNAVVTTLGTRTQKLTVRAPDGTPVVGGRIYWASDSGGRSAAAYALDDDGVVVFPRVIPGSGTVYLSGGQLPDGQTVSGTWPAVLGTDAQVLQIPQVTPYVTRRLVMTLPNGVPVPGADVEVYEGGRTSLQPGRFTFTEPVPDSGTTDQDGAITVGGYDWGVTQGMDAPIFQVTYSDGVLLQQKLVSLIDPLTTAHFDYMPWLTVSTGGSPPVGSLDPIDFTVNQQPATGDNRAGAARAASRTRSGVTVRVVPPHGWSASRCAQKSVLSGVSDASGHVHLKVCGSVSGTYAVVARGAVVSKPVRIKPHATVPTAPTRLTARSAKHGQATVSWHRPTYDNGAAITSYRVLATHGRSQRSAVVRGSTSVTLTQLTRSVTWTFSVRAVNRFGQGAAGHAHVRVG